MVNFKYKEREMKNGYNNRTLYVNLSENLIKTRKVSDFMSKTFIGGKGFDLWLMWNAFPKDKIVEWDDPENEICIANGPLGGSTFIPGSGKSIVTTVSPLTGIIVDSNVGGHFGAYLKHSGFDALEIQGIANEEIIVYIDGRKNSVEIIPRKKFEKDHGKTLPEDSHLLTQELHHHYAKDKRDLNKISVISTGPAAKYSNWGMLNFSFYKRDREWASSKQAGRGGIGTVFSHKNILAVVVKGPKRLKDIKPADKDLLKETGKKYNKEIVKFDSKQNEVRQVGTGYLPILMNEYDLFPVRNYKYGKHPTVASEEIPYTNEEWKKFFCNKGEGKDGCWMGCTLSCSHYGKHKVKTGPYKGEEVIVDGPEYETIGGCGSNWDVWSKEWVCEANFYCDTYGLDTISVGTGIAFVMECYEAGILNKDRTGGLELNWGNAEAGLQLIHQMAQGKDFGLIVGRGIRQMKSYFTREYNLSQKEINFLEDIGMEHKGLEFSEYLTKESITQQGGYGLALKGPQHDEAWLIFEDVARNSIPTFEDKAKALYWFPFWRTWFGLNGLCKIIWNDIKPPDNDKIPIHHPETGELYQARVPKHVKWYVEFYKAVTGREANEKTPIKDSERVYNFQRIFNIRLGKGLRKGDSNLPYRAMGPVTKEEYKSRQERYEKQLIELFSENVLDEPLEKKMELLRDHREAQYQELQNSVYYYRGWNEKGCPTIEKVKEIGLDIEDIIETIKPFNIPQKESETFKASGIE